MDAAPVPEVRLGLERARAVRAYRLLYQHEVNEFQHLEYMNRQISSSCERIYTSIYYSTWIHSEVRHSIKEQKEKTKESEARYPIVARNFYKAVDELPTKHIYAEIPGVSRSYTGKLKKLQKLHNYISKHWLLIGKYFVENIVTLGEHFESRRCKQVRTSCRFETICRMSICSQNLFRYNRDRAEIRVWKNLKQLRRSGVSRTRNAAPAKKTSKSHDEPSELWYKGVALHNYNASSTQFSQIITKY